jgi:hypothetical protein
MFGRLPPSSVWILAVVTAAFASADAGVRQPPLAAAPLREAVSSLRARCAFA